MQSKQANRPKSDISCNFVIVYLLLAKQKLFPEELKNAVGLVRKRQKHCSNCQWVQSHAFLVWKTKNKVLAFIFLLQLENIFTKFPQQKISQKFLQKNYVKGNNRGCCSNLLTVNRRKVMTKALRYFQHQVLQGLLYLLQSNMVSCSTLFSVTNEKTVSSVQRGKKKAI